MTSTPDDIRPDRATGRRVLVVGAQGVLGRFIAQQLSKDGWEVTRAGRRPEESPDFLQIDLADAETVRRACAEFEVVVSTAHHPQLFVEKTVLSQGGTLIDLIELSQAEQAQLDAAADAKGLVVMHTGLGGVAYLTIADMLRENSTADHAEYALMVSAAGTSGRAGGVFAHGLLAGSRHHPTAKIPFPDPVGAHRCLEVGDDTNGIPRAAVESVPVRHYLCLRPSALNGAMRALNAVRLIAALPRASFTAGSKKAPHALSEEPICEWASVRRNGRRLSSRTIEGRGYYRMTVAATSVFADALSRLANQATGVRSIDQLLTLAEILPALERRGIAIRSQSVAPRENQSR